MSDHNGTTSKVAIALTAVLQVCIGLLLAGIYLSAHNTLYNNGNWTSIKTTLSKGLMGAENFVFNLQPMANRRLGLSAWHGYQEVVSKREMDPRSVEFSFLLKKGAHLTFECNRTKRAFTGVRMSAAELFPPAVLRVTVEGEFLRKRSFRKPRWVGDQKWHRLRIEFEDEKSLTVSLDDRRLERFSVDVVRPQRIGFRGSMAGAFVRDIRVVSRSGDIFLDNFRRPSNWRAVDALAVVGTLLVSACLYLLLRRVLRVSPKLLLFYFLMLSVVVIAILLFLNAVNWRRTNFYPNATEKMRVAEAAHVESGSARMIRRIEESYSKEPEPGVERILFAGSSQTFGAGVAKTKHSPVRRVEAMLNKRSGSARRFECLNAAVEGYRIAKMRQELEERWIDWKPDVVIVNAGNNDTGRTAESWERALMSIVRSSQQAGFQLVLIPEANSVEGPRDGLYALHDATRKLAAREGIPLIEMHDYLARRVDDGFVWWDWVHLTSFGYEIFAEHLVDELVRLGVVELEAVPSPAGA